jgi:valyl-tRNA synthetase
VPFTDVYVHSIIQAPDGRRMSKSLGTGIDPMDLIDGGARPPVFAGLAGADPVGDSRGGDSPAGRFPAYGADAVRWGLLAMASGQDVRFSEDKIAQGLQLTNKLWNAARLVLMGVGEDARADIRPAGIEDRWILTRLQRAEAEITRRIEEFAFSHAALALYDFVYAELCDWYLELVKPRLRAGESALSGTLLHVLTETLALAHPMIPFVTEEIWSYVPGAEGLLAAGVPRASDGALDEAAEASLARAIEAVQALRAWRNSAGVKAGATVPARLAASGYEETGPHLERLARLQFSSDGGEPVVSVPVPGGTVEILANEHLDLEASSRKRDAERERLAGEISRAERKLANEGFVSKAPPAVVEAERAKLDRLRTELEAL